MKHLKTFQLFEDAQKVAELNLKVRELDSKGGVVKEERMDSRGNESFYKNVANRNADVNGTLRAGGSGANGIIIVTFVYP